MDQDTKSLIRGVRGFGGTANIASHVSAQLLQRNPALRMKEPRIKKHPYFSMMCVSRYGRVTGSATYASLHRDWSHVYHKRYIRKSQLFYSVRLNTCTDQECVRSPIHSTNRPF